MNDNRSDSRAERLERAIRLKRSMTRPDAAELATRPTDQPALLGEMQLSLWLAHRLEPESPAYNLVSSHLVSGPLDVQRLEASFNSIVARHRILRSTFHTERNTVVQQIHPARPLEVEVVPAAADGRDATAVREACQPLNLTVPPLVRLLLVSGAPDEAPLLLLVLHHILADERSLGFLWQELAAAYAGEALDAAPGAQYDDYVHWLRQRGPDDREAQLDYWRQRLTPPPDDLMLPFERPVPAVGEPSGRLLARDAPSATQAGIRHLASDTGVSPFTVFAFAFRLLLHRYTEGRCVAFATPVSTRSHPATARMIGYFLNPVVISAPIDEKQPIAEAVSTFGERLRDDLAQAKLPFQSLVEVLEPRRRPDRHPIFQTMFVYQDTEPPPVFGDATLSPVTLDLGASKFDLTLFVTERQSGLEIAVEFRADRFDAVWIEQLLDHYLTLLAHLPEAPRRRASELPMLTAGEREHLVRYGSGADLAPGTALHVSSEIHDRTRQASDSLALICGGNRMDYGALGRTAAAVATALTNDGVGAGDRVGVFLPRSVQTVAALLGCHWCGAAYVPLDPDYPRERTRYLLQDAELAAVLTTSQLRDELPAAAKRIIEVDSPVLGDNPPRQPDAPHPDRPAYILYTSGSTGQPKGVVVSQGNLAASTAARRQFYDEPPGRFLLVPSIAFDSSVAGLFWTLATGGCLMIPTDEEARDARRLGELVAAESVRSLLCVPSLYAQMLQAGGDNLRTLETAIVAGEICPPSLVREHFRRLPRTRLFNEYGPTEATVWASVHEVTPTDAEGSIPIGRPIPGVRIEILDDLDRPVPAGVPGTAWIAGATVAQGYWRRPELTEERFAMTDNGGREERKYRTGDRMAWTADGRLLFLGRDDAQIKLRGFRIEPGEVEAALLDQLGVTQAVVLARPLASGPTNASTAQADQLVAFVEIEQEDASLPADWRQILSTTLPAHMIPSRVSVLPRLPRLPNGKIDRRQLLDLPLDVEAPVTVEPSVHGLTEQALISLWEGLLGVSGINIDDNFFELGGHSLLVVEMAIAIERDFEVRLSAADVFATPTVRELARRIERRTQTLAPTYQHLFPIQPAGDGSPFIVAVPHFFTDMFAARFRGQRPVYGLRGVSLRPEGNRGRWRTMADLGRDLLEEILRRFPDERLIMAGYSFGASMAVEATRQLEERGVPVHRLYLIAPMPEDFYRMGPIRLQLDGLRQPVSEISSGEALRHWLRQNNPLTLRPYRRAWWWLVVQTWRRLLCLGGRLQTRLGRPLTSRVLHADLRLERFRLHAGYRPGLVTTPTVIFNAEQAATDAAATWRPFFSGPFTVIDTPDPHEPTQVDPAREVILRQLAELDEA